MFLATTEKLNSTILRQLSKLLDNRQNRGLQVQLRLVCCVDMNTHPRQGSLDGFLGSTVQHFIANRGGVRIPSNKDQLGGWTAIIRVELQVDQAVAAVIVRQVRAEIFVCLTAITRLLNLDCLLVLDLVNVVAELKSSRLKLEPLEGVCNFVIDDDTGSLSHAKRTSKQK